MRSASFSARCAQAKVDTVWARANRLAAVKALTNSLIPKATGRPSEFLRETTVRLKQFRIKHKSPALVDCPDDTYSIVGTSKRCGR